MCGNLKRHVEWLSSFGQQLWVTFFPLTISENEGLLFWIGAVMCSQMVSWQIVCLCTAQLLRGYGIWLLFCLEFLGLCLEVWWIFYHAGLADWVNPWLAESGMWFPIVSCSVYGVREMKEHLKGRKLQCQHWNSTANHFEFFVCKARFMLCLILIFEFFACSLPVYMFVSSLFDQWNTYLSKKKRAFGCTSRC